MKQLIFLVSLVLFCACQNTEDLIGNDNGSDGQSTAVTVNFTLPDGLQSRAATRAYGDGMTVNHIKWAVYKNSENDTPGTFIKDSTVLLPSGQSVLSGKFVIDKLPIGETLDFVFWAENENSGYTFNVETGTVDMNYSIATCNDENRDAFFRSIRGVTISKGQDLSVVLRRPFAQLNILTDDLPAGDDNKYSVVLGSGTFYNQLNLLTGHAVSNAGAKTVTFKAEKASGETMKIGSGSGEKVYTVISMNYLLVDGNQDDKEKDNSELHSVKFLKNEVSLLGIESKGLENVPFKRNYRTNIYGSLLTTDGSANYLIEPSFYETDLRLETLISSEEELRSYLSKKRTEATTIILADNIELNEPLDISTANNVTIDLRGRTLSASIAAVDENKFTNKPIITLNNEETVLTITDSSTPGDGNYGNLGNGRADYVIGVKQGTLILAGGDYHGKYGCVKWLKKKGSDSNYEVSDKSPVIHIDNGTFSAAEMTDGSYMLLDFNLNVQTDMSGDADWKANNIRNFIVYGGEFKNYDPSKAVVNGCNTWNFLPSKRTDSDQSVATNGSKTDGNEQDDRYQSKFDSGTERYKVTYGATTE